MTVNRPLSNYSQRTIYSEDPPIFRSTIQVYGNNAPFTKCKLVKLQNIPPDFPSFRIGLLIGEPQEGEIYYFDENEEINFTLPDGMTATRYYLVVESSTLNFANIAYSRVVLAYSLQFVFAKYSTKIDGGKQAITFNNDTEPVAVYVDGDLQENVSFVPQLAQGTGSTQYISEYKKNIISLEVSGNTTQKTYEGYNLFNKELCTSEGLRNETQIKGYGTLQINPEIINTILKPSTKYTMSFEVEGVIGMPENATVRNGQGFIFVPKTSSLYLLARSSKIANSGEVYSFKLTFTTPATFYEDNYTLYSYTGQYNIDGVVQTTYPTCIIRNVQIVEGAEAKPYEPYVSGIPSPNPQYPQEIENANDNGMSVVLRNPNLLQVVDSSGSATDTDGNVLSWVAKDGIVTINRKSNKFIVLNLNTTNAFKHRSKFKAGTYTYTPFYYKENLGEIGIKSCEWQFYDFSLGRNVAGYTNINAIQTKTIEGEFLVNACMLYITPNVEYKDYKYVPALFKGTYATLADLPPYSPYFEPTTISIPTSVEVEGATVDLNMASISLSSAAQTKTSTDYLTVDRLANKVLYHQNVGKKILTSTNMSWSIYTTGTGTVLFLSRTDIGTTNVWLPIISNKYLGYTGVGTIATKDYGITTDALWWSGSWKCAITIRDIRFDNIDDFKADLDQNPLVIEYGLAEEITHDITNTELGQALLNLATQNQTNYFEITSNEKAPQVPIKITYAKWGELVENNNNT